jgi:pimeloyl-ACP methyl ester carboxylesterase
MSRVLERLGLVGSRVPKVIFVGAALMVCLAATASSQATSSEATTAQGSAADVEESESEGDFAGLVDIGGDRKIYMECRGKGGPTVVLDSGKGDAADIWSVTSDPDNERPNVFAEVSTFTRVCAYDRPGTIRQDDELSPSTPVPQPTSAKPAAADLDALLRASGEPGPYVLVGHSYGGPIIRLYAGAHPAEVGGLVLVDALSEDIWNGLTPEQQAVYEEINTPPPDTGAEDVDHPATFQQLRESPPAPTVPTVVLTADQPQLTPEVLAAGQLPAGVDQEFADALWASQLAAQDELAKKFPGAEHITDTKSTHYIHNEQPQLVIDAIRQVVDADRDDAETGGVVEGGGGQLADSGGLPLVPLAGAVALALLLGTGILTFFVAVARRSS